MPYDKVQKRFIGPNEQKARTNDEYVTTYPSSTYLSKSQDPNLVRKEDVLRFREYLAASKDAGISDAMYKRIPGLLLTENRPDGGAGRIDTANKSDVQMYKDLQDRGYSENAARFAVAMIGAERRGNNSGRDPVEAWNGTGVRLNPDGTVYGSAKNNLRKVNDANTLVDNPMNQAFMKLLTDPKVPYKDMLAARDPVLAVNEHLGTNLDPNNTKDRYASNPSLKQKIVDRIGIEGYSSLNKIQNLDLPYGIGALLNASDQIKAGVKTGDSANLMKYASPEDLSNIDKLRYFYEPDMKESPAPTPSITDQLIGNIKSYVQQLLNTSTDSATASNNE